jgi:hypothetical protein
MGAYQRTLADMDSTKDRGVGTDGSAVVDDRFFETPVVSHRNAVFARARVTVVNEHYTMANKYVVAYADTLADKGV